MTTAYDKALYWVSSRNRMIYKSVKEVSRYYYTFYKNLILQTFYLAAEGDHPLQVI